MSSRAEEQVLIGLGGNIGDPLASMRSALQALDAHPECRVTKVSSVWRTPPWGVTDQPDLLNACAVVTTALEPRAFLDLCLSVEQNLKRVRDVRWGPRSIDIDILFSETARSTKPASSCRIRAWLSALSSWFRLRKLHRISSKKASPLPNLPNCQIKLA